MIVILCVDCLREYIRGKNTHEAERIYEMLFGKKLNFGDTCKCGGLIDFYVVSNTELLILNQLRVLKKKQ